MIDNQKNASEHVQEQVTKLGAYLISFGFDFLGPIDKVLGKDGNVTFGDLFCEEDARSVHGSTKKGKICLQQMKNEIELKSSSEKDKKENVYLTGDSIRRLLSHRTPSYEPKEIDGRIWEYFLTDCRIGDTYFDEFLVRLFQRKGNVITNKEREGFTHIKFMDTELELVSLVCLSSPAALVERVQLKMVENRYELDSEIPSIVDLTHKFAVRLRSYLFLDLNRTGKLREKSGLNTLLSNEEKFEMKLDRAAVIITLIEPKTEIGRKEMCECEFYGNPPGLYVDLGDLELGNSAKSTEMMGLWSIDERTKETFFDHYVKKSPYAIIVKASQSKSETDVSRYHTVLPLYNLLVSFAWSKIVHSVRESLGYQEEKNIESYTDFKSFEEDLVQNRHHLSFEYRDVEMKLPSTDLNQFAENATKNKEFMNTVIRLSWGGGKRNPDDIEQFLDNFVSEHMQVYFHPQSILVFYNNNAISFSDPRLFEGKYRQKKLDFAEPGDRWLISWYMMLGSMLCYAASTFMIYDEKISRHIEERREAHELADLTRQAFNDFAEYYVEGVVADPILKYEFEVAKKSMGLDAMYRTLTERLNLFSAHHMGEESARFARNAELLTILVTIIGLSTFIIDLIPIDLPLVTKYSIAAVIVGLAISVTIIVWQNKISRRYR